MAKESGAIESAHLKKTLLETTSVHWKEPPSVATLASWKEVLLDVAKVLWLDFVWEKVLETVWETVLETVWEKVLETVWEEVLEKVLEKVLEMAKAQKSVWLHHGCQSDPCTQRCSSAYPRTSCFRPCTCSGSNRRHRRGKRASSEANRRSHRRTRARAWQWRGRTSNREGSRRSAGGDRRL
jgi:hypothetical protein